VVFRRFPERRKLLKPNPEARPARSTNRPPALSPLLRIVVVVAAVGLGFVVKDLSTQSFGPAAIQRYSAQPYGVPIDTEDMSKLHSRWALGDGQAYVTIAADPTAEGPVQNLDLPGYRMARIGWSMVIRAFAWGDNDRLPQAVTIAGLASYGALAVCATRLVPTWGYRALLLLVTPGVLIALVQGTAEILGVLLLVFAISGRRPWATASAGVLLGITRPSYATALPAARNPWLPLVGASAGAALILQGYLVFGLGLERVGFTRLPVDWPGVGYVKALAPSDGSGIAIMNTLIGLILVASLGFIGLRRGGDATIGRRFAFIATAVLVLCLPAGAIIQQGSYLRVTGAAMVLLIMPMTDLSNSMTVAASPESRPTSSSG